MPDHRLVADWLAGYLQVTANLEAKESLHRWTGMVCLSAAIQRKLVLEMQHGPVYPNLYVFIIAESAKARKSTAMSYGQRMLTTAFPELRIFHDDMTPQGLVKYMYQRASKRVDKKPQGDFVLFADELADLFGYDRGRAAKMVILLTRTFMCPAEYDHLTSRDSLERLYNLYPVVIAATDPNNLRVLPAEAIGGLTGRIINVIEKDKRHINPGWIEDDTRSTLENKYLYECLVQDLQHIALMEGTITTERAARDLYNDWYKQLSHKTTGDKRTDAFFHRCHTTALQVAILLSVSAGDDRIIKHNQMQIAIETMDDQLITIGRIAVWSGSGIYEIARAKYITYLQSQGGRAIRKTLLHHMGLALDEFARITDTLVEDGTLERPRFVDTSQGRLEVIMLTKKGLAESNNGGNPA